MMMTTFHYCYDDDYYDNDDRVDDCHDDDDDEGDCVDVCGDDDNLMAKYRLPKRDLYL